MGSRREDMYKNVFLVLLNREVATAIAIDDRKYIYSSREVGSWFKKTWEAVLNIISLKLICTS